MAAKLEERYAVIKLADLDEARPSVRQRAYLGELTAMAASGRVSRGLPPLRCVVAESDWPEYGPVVASVLSRADGGPCLVGWNPGPGAPRDGSQALLLVEELGVSVGYFSRGKFVVAKAERARRGGFGVYNMEYVMPSRVLAWMPLPAIRSKAEGARA